MISGKKKFDAGRKYQGFIDGMSRAKALLDDPQVKIDVRLSALEDFEYNFKEANKITTRYHMRDEHLEINCARDRFIEGYTSLYNQRITLTRLTEEQCYDYMEQMKKTGGLEAKNIRWGEEN